MGYSHYWYQKRAFSPAEWQRITAEAKRIVAKAQRGHYSGPETAASGYKGAEVGDGFAEAGAWRTFPHPEVSTPAQGEAIAVCGSDGLGDPEFSDTMIALNGSEAKGEAYESFILQRTPTLREDEAESYECCKTEYRPYDPIVVSILAAAVLIAPDAIRATSDGGAKALRLMF